MSRISLFLTAILLALPLHAYAGEPADKQGPAGKKEFPPGWTGVFPQAPNYQQTFRKAEGSDHKKSYRQTVNYTWLGGRLESNDVTLARGEKYIKEHPRQGGGANGGGRRRQQPPPVL